MPATHKLHIEGHTLVALAYNEDRPNTPLICLHGVTSSIRFWALTQPPLVAEELCWYALSLPGHYPAVLPAGFCAQDLTSDKLATVLTAAIRELTGDRPVILVGASAGGFAALAVAAYAPDLIRAVISVSGFAHGRWTGALGLLQWLARCGPAGRALFRLNMRALTSSPGVLRASLALYAADRRALYAWPQLAPSITSCYPYARQLDADALLPYFARMPDIDIGPLLSRITAPTFVLAGDRDPCVPPAQASLIAEGVPNSELVLLEGAGHLLPAERPAAYHRILTGWLEQVL